uniref:Uncharacterized protein n=1 Tax=Panagrolaimus sp. ES5 TaxID=591445 RepID=A0AC34F1Z5_9BILA
MATKSDCNNSKFYGNATTGNQYDTLNLNQNYRHITVQNLSDFDNSRSKKYINSWNKSNKSLSPRFLNHDSGETSEVKKEGKYVNNSTLSLHIASYEATNDPLNEENECLEKKNEKSDFDKTCTNANVDGSPSLNQVFFRSSS